MSRPTRDPVSSPPADRVYPVLKPPGMTSHDVVAAVRRLCGQRRAGHAGTLDPAAAGVLVVLVGPTATRLAEYLLDLPKTYLAEVRFGLATDTQDFTGRPIACGAPEAARALSRRDVEAALPTFRGEVRQVPPMVSAVRVDGERLYRLAREGHDVRREARPVHVYALELLEFQPLGDGSPEAAGGPAIDPGVGPAGPPGLSPEPPGAWRPRARLRVTCSSGTYVRTIAHDLGRALGTEAHLGFLVREAVGPFALEESVSLEELAGARSNGEMAAWGRPPAAAVEHLPAVALGPAEAACLCRGEVVAARAPAAGTEGPTVRVLGVSGELLAVATLERGGRLRPRKVLRPPDVGRIPDGGRGS